MENEKNFLEEILEEIEKSERSLHIAHIDLVLGEIRNLEKEIATNFKNTDLEKQYLDQWVLRKNSKLQGKINWMKKKLEQFMYEQGEDVKTIDLPNGKLLRRKQPDKIEIDDIDKFMLNADSSMLTVIPEMVKPNLNKIKAYYKRSTKVPKGTKLVIGEEKFSIKLTERGGEENGETKAGAESESVKNYKAVI